MKKLAVLLLTALLLLPLFAGADEIIPANEKHPRPEIENVGEDGYLVNEDDEFIYEDAEEEQPVEAVTLDTFTDQQLADELRRRGYDVSASRQITITL